APALRRWLLFYQQQYDLVGKLVGRFYDENGAPTEALKQAEALIEEGLKLKAQSEEENQQFPPCNSEWSSSGGSRFWLSCAVMRKQCLSNAEGTLDEALFALLL
uniref:Cytochrome b5 domain containing 2 n=1 Tax=Crocodylus porosus TaxID=8502 RepID=A0A7M4EG69_CROPO